MPKPKARRREALENDVKILRAAAAMVVRVGVDRITTSGVAKEAGLTTGAMYARYEHQNELLVDLWQKVGLDAIRELLRAAVAVRRDAASPASLARIAAVYDDLAEPLNLAVQLLAVSRRVDELADVVPTDVASVLTELGVPLDGQEPDGVALLGCATLAIGSTMLAGLQGYDHSMWRTMWRWLGARPGAEPTDWPEPPATMAALAQEPDDDIVDALLQAGQQVIARSGVERATLSRIGRAARLSPTVVYTRYENRDELIADIMRRIYGMLASSNQRALIYSGPGAMATAFHAWCQADATPRRRLAIEVSLAGLYHEQIRELGADNDAVTRFTAARALADRYGSEERAAELIAVGIATSHGSALLLELGVDLGAVEWTSFATAVCEGVRAEAMLG